METYVASVISFVLFVTANEIISLALFAPSEVLEISPLVLAVTTARRDERNDSIFQCGLCHLMITSSRLLLAARDYASGAYSL